jgi:hypothetical protein
MNRKYPPAVLALAGLAFGTLVALVILEITLQFMPVRSYIPLQPVTEESPDLRYEPNIKQFYSAGWDFQVQNTGKTNAQGYIADFDFVQQDSKPLIAVIGDSYIEARMVPFADTVQERMASALRDTHRVYGVGIGGAPLSQYLAFAKMIGREYRPSFMIINIVSNDFDESLPEYKNKPRFHYFADDGTGVRRLKLIGDYDPSWITRLLSHSALVRYVYFHLDFANAFNRILFMLRGGDAPAYADNTDASVDETRLYDSKQAVNMFLRLLPEYTGLPKNRVLLVIDGMRSNIYNNTNGQDSYFGQMRTYLMQQATMRGYATLDLQPVLKAEYNANHMEFEWPEDAHWNGYAHGIVARELLSHPLLQSYLSGR